MFSYFLFFFNFIFFLSFTGCVTTGGKGGVQGVITSSDAGDKGCALGGKGGVKGEIIPSAESEEEGVKGMFSSAACENGGVREGNV